MMDIRLFAISTMVLAPQTQALAPIIYSSRVNTREIYQGHLFKDYDRYLGASAAPNPNIFAFLLMGCKNLSSYQRSHLQYL